MPSATTITAPVQAQLHDHPHEPIMVTIKLSHLVITVPGVPYAQLYFSRQIAPLLNSIETLGGRVIKTSWPEAEIVAELPGPAIADLTEQHSIRQLSPAE